MYRGTGRVNKSHCARNIEVQGVTNSITTRNMAVCMGLIKYMATCCTFLLYMYRIQRSYTYTLYISNFAVLHVHVEK